MKNKIPVACYSGAYFVTSVVLMCVICLIISLCGLFAVCLYMQAKRVQSVLDILDVGVVVCDVQGKVRFMNRQGRALWPHRPLETAVFTVGGKEYSVRVKERARFVCYLFTECDAEESSLLQGQDFVANACHELRTPITIIKGFMETLSDMPNMAQDMRVSIVEKMLKNCARLEDAVTHSLVLADLENSSSLVLTECDLVALVDKCCNMLIALHPKCHIEHFHRMDVIAIQGDVHLLELAIMNILQNAVKYSKEPARITVCLDQKENGVVLSIRDRGFGISEEEQKKVFCRFYKAQKGLSQRRGGAGLGLYMVKRVLDHHKADIELSSVMGEGSRFILRFPLPVCVE